MTTAASDQGVAAEVAALDMLLTQAALGPTRRFFPGKSSLRFAGALARRPHRVAIRTGALAAELGRITLGASQVAPSSGDRRFADPAWTQNPVLRRVVQAYLAAGETGGGLVQDVPMDWQDAERVNFVASNLLQALSPSNNPLLSPVAWKTLIAPSMLDISTRSGTINFDSAKLIKRYSGHGHYRRPAPDHSSVRTPGAGPGGAPR
jgi:polyhydroxyalkanoate synthase subunit PhaC